MRSGFLFRSVSVVLILSFISSTIYPSLATAQNIVGLPQVGAMLNLSPAYTPAMIKGLRVHPDQPLLFDFIIDAGDSGLKAESTAFRGEADKLIKYFLAALTIKETDLWVNLSPYEKDRMLVDELGRTEMGRAMLAQDYILKQIASSLLYPEKGTGKAFWSRIYAQAQDKFGTTTIPVDTFNKVWITADKAKVLEKNNAAYVVDSYFKVQLESDHLAENKALTGQADYQLRNNELALPLNTKEAELAKQILREVVIPAIEKEVNEGENFAPLRQIFHSMILASWYKIALKKSLLNQVYSDQALTGGVENADPLAGENIYQQYLTSYKQGVFNYIKEDANLETGETFPRKYFSGGEYLSVLNNLNIIDMAQATTDDLSHMTAIGDITEVTTNLIPQYHDRAMGLSVSEIAVNGSVIDLALNSDNLELVVRASLTLERHKRFLESVERPLGYKMESQNKDILKVKQYFLLLTDKANKSLAVLLADKVSEIEGALAAGKGLSQEVLIGQAAELNRFISVMETFPTTQRMYVPYQKKLIPLQEKMYNLLEEVTSKLQYPFDMFWGAFELAEPSNFLVGLQEDEITINVDIINSALEFNQLLLLVSAKEALVKYQRMLSDGPSIEASLAKADTKLAAILQNKVGKIKKALATDKSPSQAILLSIAEDLHSYLYIEKSLTKVNPDKAISLGKLKDQTAKLLKAVTAQLAGPVKAFWDIADRVQQFDSAQETVIGNGLAVIPVSSDQVMDAKDLRTQFTRAVDYLRVQYPGVVVNIKTMNSAFERLLQHNNEGSRYVVLSASGIGSETLGLAVQWAQTDTLKLLADGVWFGGDDDLLGHSVVVLANIFSTGSRERTAEELRERTSEAVVYLKKFYNAYSEAVDINEVVGELIALRDSRKVAIVSLRYGKGKDGKLSLLFEPLTRPELREAGSISLVAGTKTTDAAASTGGIDLNAGKMDLDIAHDDKSIEIKLDPAMIAQFQRGDFSGITPVIIKVTPMASPFMTLGTTGT